MQQLRKWGNPRSAEATFKKKLIPGNLQKKIWKHHGILSLQKSGNPVQGIAIYSFRRNISEEHSLIIFFMINYLQVKLLKCEDSAMTAVMQGLHVKRSTFFIFTYVFHKMKWNKICLSHSEDCPINLFFSVLCCNGYRTAMFVIAVYKDSYVVYACDFDRNGKWEWFCKSKLRCRNDTAKMMLQIDIAGPNNIVYRRHNLRLLI